MHISITIDLHLGWNCPNHGNVCFLNVFVDWMFIESDPEKYFASSDLHHGIQFIPSDILSGKSSGILSGIRFDILSGILSGISSGILSVISSASFLAVEVRLRSGEAHSAYNSAGWGPARPTALRISPVEVRRGPQRSDSRRLRSGEAQSDRELADEIRRGPLRSRAGRGGPAREEGKKEGRKEGRRRRATDIKSNNPNLAGGEKTWGTSQLNICWQMTREA